MFKLRLIVNLWEKNGENGNAEWKANYQLENSNGKQQGYYVKLQFAIRIAYFNVQGEMNDVDVDIEKDK